MASIDDKYALSVTAFLGRELGGGFTGWFWLRICPGFLVEMSAEAVSSEGLPGAAGPISQEPSWCRSLAGGLSFSLRCLRGDVPMNSLHGSWFLPEQVICGNKVEAMASPMTLEVTASHSILPVTEAHRDSGREGEERIFATHLGCWPPWALRPQMC